MQEEVSACSHEFLLYASISWIAERTDGGRAYGEQTDGRTDEERVDRSGGG